MPTNSSNVTIAEMTCVKNCANRIETNTSYSTQLSTCKETCKDDPGSAIGYANPNSTDATDVRYSDGFHFGTAATPA